MINDLDYQQLDKLLDRVKVKVFLGKNAAFIGSLMCDLNFIWSEDIQTACTNGLTIQWNPHWFLKLPEDTRKSVLMHELWHVALLHPIRFVIMSEDFPNEILQTAADIFINNMLDDEYDDRGKKVYTFEESSPSIDHSYDGKSFDEIADDLLANQEKFDELFMQGIWGSGDMFDVILGALGDEAAPDLHQMLNKVVGAATAAKISGKPGDVPGEVETLLKRFLAPKLPWQQLLQRFFQGLSENDYKWSRPNRRYSDMYLPSLQPDGGLEHILLFEDVSGSVSDAECLRFNSEFKYIKDIFNPQKITLVQFDTIIQKVLVFNQEDPFDEIVIMGRGGTSLVCVRDMIIEQQPTAVVIFSDLQCDPMEKLIDNIPIIWVCINNFGAQVNEGQLIHIKE